MLKLVIHFNFYKVWGLGWRVFFLTYGCPIVPRLFDENSILSLLSCFCSFVKPQACLWVFLCSLFCSNVYVYPTTITTQLLLFHLSVSSVQSLSRVLLFATPGTAAHQASLSITNYQSLLKLTSIELVMPSNHLIFCHPLLLPTSIFARTRVFSNESVLCIRWPKYWSFSFNMSPSNEYSGPISLSMEQLDLPAVQGTLQSLPQHHSWKATTLWHSAFFRVQLSHSGKMGMRRWPREKSPKLPQWLSGKDGVWTWIWKPHGLDRGAWGATVHTVTKSWTRLSD